MSSVIRFASRLGRGRATRRASLAAVVLAAGWLCLGAASAWADSVIDTTGCTIDGRAELSGTPSSPNQLGAEFVASDNPQAVTLALYNADSTGPVGPPLWTAPATVDSTGSPTTFALQTFTIDSPGDIPVSLGQLSVTGANAADFIVVADQCSAQRLTTAQSCTVGVRFAPRRPAADRAPRR